MTRDLSTCDDLGHRAGGASTSPRSIAMPPARPPASTCSRRSRRTSTTSSSRRSSRTPRSAGDCRSRQRSARRRWRSPDDAGAVRLLRSRTRASSRCWTRSSTTCPRPLDVPPVHGIEPGSRRRRRPRRRAHGRRLASPSRLLGLQDHGRPLRRQADLLPRLLRHARRRATRVLNVSTGKTERIGRILMMHANDRAGGRRGLRRATSPRPSASSRSRPATRWPRPPRRSSSSRSPSPSR